MNTEVRNESERRVHEQKRELQQKELMGQSPERQSSIPGL